MLLIKKILLGVTGTSLFAGSWYGIYKLMWIIDPGYKPMDPMPPSQKPLEKPSN